MLAAELLWESEPPSVAYNASHAETFWRKPQSSFCDPQWAEVAYCRIRDLDDWNTRKTRLAGMTRGKGKGKAKAGEADTGGLDGQAAPGGPAVKTKKPRPLKAKAGAAAP